MNIVTVQSVKQEQKHFSKNIFYSMLCMLLIQICEP